MIVGIFFMILPILLGTLNFILSIINKTGEFNLTTILSGEIFSNWGYTFWETLLDFDFFLSEFWFNVLFCLIVASICVLYGQTPEYIRIQPDYKILSNRCRIFGIIAGIILILAIIGSVFDWGLARPYLSGQTFNLWMGNSYDEHFSNFILPLAFLLGGFPALLYIMARSTFIDSQKWSANRIGIWMIGIAIGIIQILIIVNKIDLLTIFDGTALSVLIYSVFDIFFIIGVICVIEARSRKIDELLKTPDAETNLNSTSELKSESSSSPIVVAQENGIDTNSNESEENPNGESILDNLKEEFEKGVEFIKTKVDPRLIRHVYRYTFFLFCVIIVGVIVVSYFNAYLTIDHFKLIQHVLSFIFRVMLTLSFYYFGAYLISERFLEEEGDK
jgi:hypothetical protein